MGLLNKDKNIIEQQSQEIENLRKLVSPEMNDLLTVKTLTKKYIDYNSQLEQKQKQLQNEISVKTKELNELQQDIIQTNEMKLFQSFNLYEPKFDFVNVEQYKDALKMIRDKEKELIKMDKAVTSNNSWTVNGSTKEGQKMVSDFKKLMLRSFNIECDDIVNKVKVHNYDASEKRIRKSCEQIAKLGKIINIQITNSYLNLKIKELQLALEYAIAKEKEREAIRAKNEELREEEKLRKEIEAQKQKALKEKTQYELAIKQLEAQANKLPQADYIAKYNQYKSRLDKINTNIDNLDYREANAQAGFVYIISNIGSFGENVYKIGMTRRLNPQDRIDELGSASVPFKFDKHAAIFSNNARKLESALHEAFADKRVNMVNSRKEFFNVTLDEIKDVVKKNFDNTVEFYDIPDAEEFRETLKIKQKR